MERTPGGKGTVITEELRTALDRTSRLSPAEERVLRLTRGVGVPHAAPLARAAPAGSELADELLLLEMQLVRQMRARTAAGAASPVKSKIVRALKKRR